MTSSALPSPGLGAPESISLAPVGTHGPRPAGGALSLILDWLGPLAGRSLLDVGCGGGGLARALTARGAGVTGVDPLAQAVDAARSAVPEARFQQAGAEALPFAAGSFDGAVFVNSLHHVPVPLMAKALQEALRVSRGPVLVIEPLAGGAFFEAMRPVEDESTIRAAAQAAIAAAAEAGTIVVSRSGEYDDVRRFSGVDAFLAKIVAVDPARAEAAQRVRPEVTALFERWGTRDAEGMRLDQPHRAHLLVAGTGPS